MNIFHGVEPAKEDVIQVKYGKRKWEREEDLKKLPIEVVLYTFRMKKGFWREWVETTSRRSL